MAAHKDCRFCRYGGGICQSGFKKVHDLGAMRPRTPSRSPRRPQPNRGRGRPRTPSRSPPRPTRGRVRPRTPSRSPRRVTLRSGPTWRDVQRVQDHMKACRDNLQAQLAWANRPNHPLRRLPPQLQKAFPSPNAWSTWRRLFPPHLLKGLATHETCSF